MGNCDVKMSEDALNRLLGEVGWERFHVVGRGREFFYWAHNEFGLKPIIRLNHVVIYPLGDADDASVAIASKQLYASHYFHTALELKFAVTDSSRPNTEGFYLISLSRSRSDGLTGISGRIMRTVGQSRARRGLAALMKLLKTNLEAAYSERQ